jgi:WD40 repeat protein/basic membrane lipoprotein Med (substrate-binding protein (PBP1-ABC) superfamily)/DNA-binding SARP family transcriptional activator
MLEIRLLGQFDVRRDGAPIAIPSRPAQSLLAYLVLNPGVAHRREKLAGLLSPDSTEANARSNLRHALWRVRKSLGADPATGRDYLLVDEIAIGFDTASRYWLDVAAIEARVADSPDDLIGAASAYGGELLPGFYDEWVVLERERLQAVFELKTTRLLDGLVETRRWDAVLEWGERWIALGHAPEPAYRALMIAHSGLGDRSGAAAAYHRCVEALRRELGVEPSEQTRALFERLARGERVAAMPAMSLPSTAPPLEDESPAPGDPPYKGLHHFDEADAGLFFGREALIARLAARLTPPTSPDAFRREREEGQGWGVRFLAIIGASGSGKSSLVRAGLIPALKRDGSRPIRLITPTAHPTLTSLRPLPDPAEGGEGQGAPSPDSSGEGWGGGLLIVDQFEELFTLCHDEAERKAFIETLMRAAASPSADRRSGERRRAGQTCVVVALRADFYAHCAQYPGLREALARNQEYIGPMSAEELRRAIEEPARRGGWAFEPGLVDLLLRDAGDEPGALPLLSHALLETWKRRRGRMLTLRGYAESGGVRGAIARTAESVFHRLTPDQQAIARSIFLRLTEPGEDAPAGATRRRAPRSELVSNSQSLFSVEAVLNTLADARLITTGENSVEVAHEALIREWPTLRQWLAEDRDGLQLHRHLTEAAQAWDELDRDPGELYRGARLVQAIEWAESHPDELNVLERVFLDAAHTQAEREQAEREAQRRRELEAALQLAETQARAAAQLRRRALYLAGAFVLALGLAGAALFLGGQARQAAIAADNERRIAASRELAAASIDDLSIDPERGILLALEAVSVTQSAGLPVPLEAEDALHRAVQTSRLDLVLRGHAQWVTSVAFSPDGARLATSSRDRMVKVWEAASGRELLSVPAHAASVWNVVFSPDGTRLATASDDFTARVWDASTGQELLVLRGHTKAVNDVAFSPDGGRIATTSGDWTARVWDASSGRELLDLRHAAVVLRAAFSADGARLATADAQGTVKVWDASSGEELLALAAHADEVWGVAFDPRGARLATAGWDGATKVWNLPGGDPALTLTGHVGEVLDVAFSPDGSRLATAGADRKVKVWRLAPGAAGDAATGRELFTLSGHSAPIYDLAFSAGGSRLASASQDGTARVWNVSLSREWLTIPIREGSSGRIAASPDGSRVAAGVGDVGEVKVWDAATGREALSLTGHTGRVESVAFSADGARLATAGRDKKIVVWDAHTGEMLLTLTGHDGSVLGAAFSPDGARLATAGDDWMAKVWDTRTGEELLSLLGSAPMSDVAFSPDGRQIVTAGMAGAAKVWDAATGQEILALHGRGQELWGVTFSHDSRRVATADEDGSVVVWDAATGDEVLTLRGHAAAVAAVAFGPDDQRIATASRDGTARVWDAAAGRELLVLRGDGAGLRSVAFSPDGSRLIAGGDDGVRVYLLRIDDLAALAHTRVTRSLTADECVRYLHRERSACASLAQIPITETPAPSAARRICEVTDVGGLYDSFFSQLAYEGAQDAARQFGWNASVVESKALSEFGPNIEQFLQSGCDLIVTVAFTMSDATYAAARANPNQRFLILDAAFDAPLDNVRGQLYASDQAAFLAGYVAASVSKTGKVGTFGGIDIPTVTDFMDGFALGVEYYNARNGAAVRALGWDAQARDGLFAGTFVEAEAGRRLAGQLLDEGADVILPVAGTQTGYGAADVARSRGAYLIGVDTDWTITAPEFAGIVLTSIEKRLDVSVVEAVRAIEGGAFAGGVRIGTLASGEVGLAPFRDLDRLVSARIKSDLRQIEADIIAGKIATKP